MRASIFRVGRTTWAGPPTTVLLVLLLLGVPSATPSDGSETCDRSVGDDDDEDALHAAFTAASAPAAAACAVWRVAIVGSHDLTRSIAYTATTPLEVRGPAGGTAVLRAVAAPTKARVEHRVLTATVATSVRLERLVLTGGDVVAVVPTPTGGDGGGAVLTDVLHLRDVELRGNRAVVGGAVEVVDLDAVQVSFLANEAEIDDGLGGAVYATGDVVLTNVTFQGNRAKEGGALWHFGGTGTLTATFVTFRTNRASVSGGHLHLDTAPATAVIRGSVLGPVTAGSTVACGDDGSLAGSFAAVDWTGTFASDASCGVPGARVLDPAPTFVSVPFRTGMQDLSGPAADGPLIDTVACGAGWPTVDQRGVTRPQGAAGRCDAGAVEREIPTVVLQESGTTSEGADGTEGAERAFPVPTRIPAGGGACADGCPAITSDADGPAPQR